MKLTHLRRTGGIAAVALTLSLGLAACSEEEPETTASDTTTTSEAPAEESSEEMGAEAQTYGPGCSSVPDTGDGSFDGMATAPVASAASANPLLTTLVTAVSEAELVEPLNSAEALTVFAPANPAFEAIPKKDLNALLKDKEALTGVLTHHVVAEQIAPEDLSGEFETLAGDTVVINGEGEEATIGDENAAVLCGNIPTANATVYVIDTVLIP
ncbi:fasciclin domain-containing protein [Nocardioides sp. GCM10027113]|uniref:fasciclin domain-containing protein n=1 Tax=unclassified Nocardioides TaxID=2615069 RepID=UPI003620F07F